MKNRSETSQINIKIEFYVPENYNKISFSERFNGPKCPKPKTHPPLLYTTYNKLVFRINGTFWAISIRTKWEAMYLFVFSHVLANFLAQKIHPLLHKKTRENCKKIKIDQKKWPNFLGHPIAIVFKGVKNLWMLKARVPTCRPTCGQKTLFHHRVSFREKILQMEGPQPKIGPHRVRTSENSWKWTENRAN